MDPPPSHLLHDALSRLDALTRSDASSIELVSEGTLIAEGWWFEAERGLGAQRVPLLVSELRRCCHASARRHELAWERFNNLGWPRQADRARRLAEALDRARQVLRAYD